MQKPTFQKYSINREEATSSSATPSIQVQGSRSGPLISTPPHKSCPVRLVIWSKSLFVREHLTCSHEICYCVHPLPGRTMLVPCFRARPGDTLHTLWMASVHQTLSITALDHIKIIMTSLFWYISARGDEHIFCPQLNVKEEAQLNKLKVLFNIQMSSSLS